MSVYTTDARTAIDARRCHLWCWMPAREVPWEHRTLVVGALSPFGLVLAGLSAAVSASENRRRRDAAIRDAAPRWRYVTSGTGWLEDGRLVVTDTNGIVRTFDLATAPFLDTPQEGWLRMKTIDGGEWAIQVK